MRRPIVDNEAIDVGGGMRRHAAADPGRPRQTPATGGNRRHPRHSMSSGSFPMAKLRTKIAKLDQIMHENRLVRITHEKSLVRYNLGS
jgi:hypothetical protein